MPLSPNPNTFANFPLDRAGPRRRDEAWLREALSSPAARLIPFHQLRPFVLANGAAPEAGWLAAHTRAAVAGENAMWVFLGVDADGAPHFAVEVPPNRDPADSPLAGLGDFQDMRAAAMQLPAGDTAMLGCAKSIIDWHARHRFCANCGADTKPVEAGWKRICASCNTEHFPRVDPVVIMLATIGERCLLGRQPRFPPKMYSALAGFIEPGESIEEACARELEEEAGVKAVAVRYVHAQPWPFPSQLMIGLIAEVADDQITIDHEELSDARWFSRDDARAMIEGRFSEAWAPPPLAIAHHILKAWAFE